MSGPPASGRFYGKGPMARIKGTKNDDVIVGSITSDTIRGNKGDDLIFGYGDGSGVGGTPPPINPDGGGPDDHDNISGGSGNDEIHAGDGNDNVRGGRGNDDIYGGAGSDGQPLGRLRIKIDGQRELHR